MVFGLPAIGEGTWGQKILDSINAVKATADAAQPSATLDAGVAAVDANAASALRVQQDARLSATYALKPTNGARAIGKGELVPNVKDYGAIGDGVADDTAAIQAAHDALPASGGALYFPAGTYKVSGAIAITKPALVLGTGYGSKIQTSSATANIFTISAEFVTMRDLNMTASVVRTGGWYVDVLASASRFRIENFFMDGPHGGIRTLANATCTISNGMILNGTAGTGVAVRVDDGFDVTINDLLVDASAQTYAGIYVTNAGDVTVTDCQIIHAGNGLFLRAATGDTIASTWARDSFFDGCTNGVVLDASGGSIVRTGFNGCWMSSATGWGIKLETFSGGAINGTDILGCHIFLNGSGGILLADTGVTNTLITDSAICQNTGSGITINAAITDFSIIGNKIGDGYGLTGNDYGIFFNSAAASYFQISSNNLEGNTTAAISGTPTLGANRLISDNLGANMGATSNPTVTASPFTYTAGPQHETVYINGGTVSLITVDGSAVFLQTNQTVRLGPGKSVVITYSAVPGVAVTKD